MEFLGRALVSDEAYVIVDYCTYGRPFLRGEMRWE